MEAEVSWASLSLDDAWEPVLVICDKTNNTPENIQKDINYHLCNRCSHD